LKAWAQSTDGGQSEIVIKADKTLYPFFYPIIITGQIDPERLVEGQENVTITITRPDGSNYVTEPAKVNNKGAFSFQLTIPNDQPAGNYLAVASYGELSAETSFRVDDVIVDGIPADKTCFSQICSYELKQDNQTYRLDYVMAGRITDISVNKERNSITVAINSSESFRLQIGLPRSVINAVDSQGNDIEFVVFADGQRVNSFDTMRNETLRTLAIDYESDTKTIEIVGTQVVPEFGPVSLLVLGAAGVSAIVWRHRIQVNDRSFSS
ncbi:MAG: MG2 domain-containing protein, partial [Thermoproteota archaeon]